MSARTDAASAARSASASSAAIRVPSKREALGREVVVAARLHRGQPLAQAGQRERVVAHGGHVMLGLPRRPRSMHSARVQRVDDAPAEEVGCGRRPRKLRIARRLAEEQAEARPGGAVGKRAAGVSERSNWSASGNRNPRGRWAVGPRSRSVRCIAPSSSLSLRVQSSSTSATGTRSAMANVRSRSQKRSPPACGQRAHGRSGSHALVRLREPQDVLCAEHPAAQR